MMGNRKSMMRLGAAFAVVAVAVVVYVIRPAADASTASGPAMEATVDGGLPRLLDLGADKCVPCKMMAPILEELGTEFADVFIVEFVDVWKNPAAAEPYKLRVIPTQIFFDADGNQLFRHEGFYGREDILAKWRELGLEVPEKGA